MTAYVVDTNVLAVANGRDTPQASLPCQSASVQKMIECAAILNEERLGRIVLDSAGEILAEYRSSRVVNPSGKPGTGDMFFKLLWQRQRCLACEQVTLTPHIQRGYEEFPDAAGLAGFDRSDRKFVAAALASRNSPEILNAVDSGWYHFEKALRDAGVVVRQLCPDCFSR